MPNIQKRIESILSDAVVAAFGPEHADADPLINPTKDPKFGDYQANLAMGLAKKLGQKPRDIATAIVEKIDADDLFSKIDIAGPGFINLMLTQETVNQSAETILADLDRLAVAEVDEKQTVVVDFSSPNVAKEMHVGHIRSTVIGDALARIFKFLGHDVIKQNHVGDWGTQFGMLIQYMDEMPEADREAHEAGEGDTLNTIYQKSKQRFDAEDDFAQRARERVVALQAGDEETLVVWQKLVNESETYFDAVYKRLGIDLSLDDIKGESFYNPRLGNVIKDLKTADLLKESQGADVVYPEGFKDRDGNPMPMIVRKSDGGFLYATTDLAAAQYRINDLNADRIVYVTDSRQSQHFSMVFQTLREAGWAPSNVRLDHVPFGTIMGKDRKPFKTRSGETIKLVDLIDEAESRAAGILADKNPDMDTDTAAEVAHTVGIGCLKYADLSNDRIKDYIFDWDRMLSFDGNTAAYLQNSYVRCMSIFRRGEVDPSSLSGAKILATEPAERLIVLKLLQLPNVLQSVADSLEPHRLTNYLYELASLYHSFYEKCPVLKSEGETKISRLALCLLTAQTISNGLALLGIDTPPQM
ncbi:arginine--tRNA ligase [Poriferisphaera corsica]|uniref:arginine--tRNA ligase n=1 Tax=Poriferisphaera corsica TaxID=2528020 RepID=UPI0011A24D6F|nr:arginine--tRNA ligase [Poriferisphaera corsica]